MSETTARTLFSATCLAGVTVIAVAAILEIIRQRKGESLLRAGQFRLRIFSALIWIILLGAMAIAVAFLWPQKGDFATMRKFASVLGGSLSLLLIALFLLAYDFWQINRQRQITELKFNHQLDDMARAEIEKIQHEKTVEKAPNTDGTS